jgi:SHS2 domain-containing protein
MPFRFLDHTGDTAVELIAPSEAELLREGTRALCAILIDIEAGPAPRRIEAREVALDAEDGEALLVDYLNELVFLFDHEAFLGYDLEGIDVHLDPPSILRATVWGERFDPQRHVFLTEVKAATFHDLSIRRTDEGVSAVVVFDL